MKIIELSAEEAKQMIDNGCGCYLLLSHDLENGVSLGKSRVNKNKGKVLITNSKTIVLNQDEEEEDSFSTLSLYTAFQKDIFNINRIGRKHDMILFNMDMGLIPKLE